MSVRSFRFVSPGVFVKEIDNSQLPSEAPIPGPVVIGRAPSGPAMRPYTVQSFSEFVTVFGNPVPGGQGGDIWRNGNYSSPMYGQYAAQAYLANSNNLTYVRLLGAEDPNRTADGRAGWQLGAGISSPVNGLGAWGLYVFPSGSIAGAAAGDRQSIGTGSLSAIFYGNSSCTIRLSGTLPINNFQSIGSQGSALAYAPLAASGTNLLVNQTDATKQFKLLVNNPKADVTQEIVTFNFNKNSSKYIRKVFNTNPQLTNTGVTDSTVAYNYFLGETFDRFMNGNVPSNADTFAALIPLYNSTQGAASDFRAPLQGAETPQVIGCDLVQRAATEPASTNSYDSDVDPQKLFKFVALGEPGDWSNRNIKVSISDIKVSTNLDNDYGTFSVEVRWVGDSDNVVQIMERFDGCNLNPNSLNYVARKVGDMFRTWNTTEKRYIENGDWPNRSQLVRIVMNTDVSAGLTNAKLLPFGFQGMLQYVDLTVDDNNAAVGWAAIGTDAIVPGNDIDPAAVLGLSGSVILTRGGPEGSTATLADILTMAGPPANGDNFTVNVPTSVGGTGATITVKLVVGTPSDGTSNQVEVEVHSSTETTVDRVVGAINGTASPVVAYGAGSGDTSNGIAGIGAAEGTTPATDITITAAAGGVGGNSVTFTDVAGTMVAGGANGSSPATLAGGAAAEIPFSLVNPVPELRVSASDGNIANPTDAYWGFQTAESAGSTTFDRSTIDLLRPRGGLVSDMFGGATSGVTETSMVFTLDDLSASADGSTVVWVSGSHKAGDSMTVVSGAISGVLANGYDRFTVPVYGGFDGTSVLEMDYFNNTDLADKSELNSAPFYSIKRAIDSVADPEVVEMNLTTVPGLTHEGLTTHLINTCEARADALAIIDLKGGYKARAEGTSADRRATSAVKTTIDNLKARGLNSSYGCAFFPWVQARDTIQGSVLWVPPSVAALGTFSSSARKTQVWFAPAGFNRGGLSQGAAGLPIANVSQQLTRKQRDDLYAANVNPIAKFPAEGIVVFGQKTLQVTPSALDRINVRRLLIFVKKRISQIAATILFQPNVQATWDNFTGRVVPFLKSVQAEFGLSDFKVVLDESTTTAELIDRNILYAKIFLKPTRAIEYIALDFNITRTGASFDD